MAADPASFPRRPPRIGLFQEVRPFYFVTFNVRSRRPVLANKATHGAFIDFGVRARDEHGVAVSRYVLMPDHVHLFVCLPETGLRLMDWVGGLKRRMGVGLSANGVDRPIW